MPAFLGPLIAGGLSLIGGLAANSANKKRAAEQMAFQERMSSTSYQRAVTDMKMSGINPMLAYQQGGASSPGGAQAQMQDVVGPAVSSAMHAKRMGEELATMRSQRNLLDNQANVALTQAGLNQMHTNMGAEQMDGIRIQNMLHGAELPRAQWQALMDRSKAGRFGMAADRVYETISPWAQALIPWLKQGGPGGRPFGLRGGSSIRGRY